MAKRLAVMDADRCVGCQSCMFACARRMGQGGLAASCLGVHSAGGVRRVRGRRVPGLFRSALRARLPD